MDLSIEYNFNIRTSEKHLYLIHHKLTPTLLSDNGNIWLVLCTVSLSPEKDIGDVVISDHICTDRYVYSFESGQIESTRYNRFHAFYNIIDDGLNISICISHIRVINIFHSQNLVRSKRLNLYGDASISLILN